MAVLLTFAVTLVVAVLISARLHRSVLSTALLFGLVGFLAGDGVLGWVHLHAGDHLVFLLAQVALFTVLFTDGMHAGADRLRAAWRLPGRALLLGMPLTFIGTALLAKALTPLDWKESFLVAAVLTPTDPVFAAAIVGRVEVPARLRHLLNVESGLNDGLALPVVLILISLVSTTHVSIHAVLWELVLGVAFGITLPWALLRLEALSVFGAFGRYQAMNALAIGLLLFALCEVTRANPFLAAFAGGSTVATVSPAARQRFEALGEVLTELAKLAALLVFGALLTPTLFTGTTAAAYLWALLLLLAVRPLSLAIALVGERLDTVEWAAAAWFGPKGFASVTYGLLVLFSHAVHASLMFNLISVVIAISIVAHSTTDTVIARVFIRRADLSG